MRHEPSSSAKATGDAPQPSGERLQKYLARTGIAWDDADVHVGWTGVDSGGGGCDGGDNNPTEGRKGLMGHRSTYPHGPGKQANFIFWDGHAKNRRWAQTVLPLKTNQWVLDIDSDVDLANNQVHYSCGDVRTIVDVCYTLK